MYSQNLYGSIFIENVNELQIIETNKFNLITFIQKNIFESLGKLLPQEQLGILLGMIIGDTFYISDEVTKQFKQSGITHLLAVSGSNVTYIILATKFLFNKLLGKSISNYITILMIILFVLVSGASPSVVRAGIMAIILILSEILSRSPHTASTISVTALLILIYNPLVICDVGFILSFGGTIGIVLFNQTIINFLNTKCFIFSENKIFKYIIDMLSVTLSAQIILFPIIWYYFNNISFISVFTNLLVGPFVGVITILGLIIYLFSLFFLPAAKLLSYAIYILISLVMFISKLCSNVPFGNLTFPTPSILFIITYYLLLVMIIIKNIPKKFINYNEKINNKDNIIINNKVDCNKKHKFISSNLTLSEKEIDFSSSSKDNKFLNVFSCDKLDTFLNRKIEIIKYIISILIIIQILIIIIPKNYIEINTIDVGQGDCTLIKTNNYNILIDGGGSENSNYNVGKNILVPYLLDNTNGVIDLMIISHFHEDHAEGCVSVLEMLNVKKIIIGIQPIRTKLYDIVLKISKEKNIPIITLSQGNIIKLDNLKFEILFPKDKLEIDDLNNNSLVIRLDYYDMSMLFTGDIEKETEKLLLSNINKDAKKKIYNFLDIDILKVAHHGSKSSSTIEFLQLATPQIALISLGEDNKFGHPNEDVIKRLMEVGSTIFRTDENGEISLKIYKNGKIKIKTQI